MDMTNVDGEASLQTTFGGYARRLSLLQKFQYILTYHSVGYRFRERNQSLEHYLCAFKRISRLFAVLIGAD